MNTSLVPMVPPQPWKKRPSVWPIYLSDDVEAEFMIFERRYMATSFIVTLFGLLLCLSEAAKLYQVFLEDAGPHSSSAPTSSSRTFALTWITLGTILFTLQFGYTALITAKMKKLADLQDECVEGEQETALVAKARLSLRRDVRTHEVALFLGQVGFSCFYCFEISASSICPWLQGTLTKWMYCLDAYCIDGVSAIVIFVPVFLLPFRSCFHLHLLMVQCVLNLIEIILDFLPNVEATAAAIAGSAPDNRHYFLFGKFFAPIFVAAAAVITLYYKEKTSRKSFEAFCAMDQVRGEIRRVHATLTTQVTSTVPPHVARRLLKIASQVSSEGLRDDHNKYQQENSLHISITKAPSMMPLVRAARSIRDFSPHAAVLTFGLARFASWTKSESASTVVETLHKTFVVIDAVINSINSDRNSLRNQSPSFGSNNTSKRKNHHHQQVDSATLTKMQTFGDTIVVICGDLHHDDAEENKAINASSTMASSNLTELTTSGRESGITRNMELLGNQSRNISERSAAQDSNSSSSVAYHCTELLYFALRAHQSLLDSRLSGLFALDVGAVSGVMFGTSMTYVAVGEAVRASHDLLRRQHESHGVVTTPRFREAIESSNVIPNNSQMSSTVSEVSGARTSIVAKATDASQQSNPLAGSDGALVVKHDHAVPLRVGGSMKKVVEHSPTGVDESRDESATKAWNDGHCTLSADEAERFMQNWSGNGPHQTEIDASDEMNEANQSDGSGLNDEGDQLLRVFHLFGLSSTFVDPCIEHEFRRFSIASPVALQRENMGFAIIFLMTLAFFATMGISSIRFFSEESIAFTTCMLIASVFACTGAFANYRVRSTAEYNDMLSNSFKTVFHFGAKESFASDSQRLASAPRDSSSLLTAARVGSLFVVGAAYIGAVFLSRAPYPMTNITVLYSVLLSLVASLSPTYFSVVAHMSFDLIVLVGPFVVAQMLQYRHITNPTVGSTSWGVVSVGPAKTVVVSPNELVIDEGSLGDFVPILLLTLYSFVAVISFSAIIRIVHDRELRDSFVSFKRLEIETSRLRTEHHLMLQHIQSIVPPKYVSQFEDFGRMQEEQMKFILEAVEDEDDAAEVAMVDGGNNRTVARSRMEEVVVELRGRVDPWIGSWFATPVRDECVLIVSLLPSAQSATRDSSAQSVVFNGSVQTSQSLLGGGDSRTEDGKRVSVEERQRDFLFDAHDEIRRISALHPDVVLVKSVAEVIVFMGDHDVEEGARANALFHLSLDIAALFKDPQLWQRSRSGEECHISLQPWMVLHSGPTVGAVIGVDRLTFELFGEVINSSMEIVSAMFAEGIVATQRFVNLFVSWSSQHNTDKSLILPNCSVNNDETIGAPDQSNGENALFPALGRQRKSATVASVGGEGNADSNGDFSNVPTAPEHANAVSPQISRSGLIRPPRVKDNDGQLAIIVSAVPHEYPTSGDELTEPLDNGNSDRKQSLAIFVEKRKLSANAEDFTHVKPQASLQSEAHPNTIFRSNPNSSSISIVPGSTGVPQQPSANSVFDEPGAAATGAKRPSGVQGAETSSSEVNGAKLPPSIAPFVYFDKSSGATISQEARWKLKHSGTISLHNVIISSK